MQQKVYIGRLLTIRWLRLAGCIFMMGILPIPLRKSGKQNGWQRWSRCGNSKNGWKVKDFPFQMWSWADRLLLFYIQIFQMCNAAQGLPFSGMQVTQLSCQTYLLHPQRL